MSVTLHILEILYISFQISTFLPMNLNISLINTPRTLSVSLSVSVLSKLVFPSLEPAHQFQISEMRGEISFLLYIL